MTLPDTVVPPDALFEHNPSPLIGEGSPPPVDMSSPAALIILVKYFNARLPRLLLPLPVTLPLISVALVAALPHAPKPVIPEPSPVVEHLRLR